MNKNAYAISKNDLTYGRGYVYSLQYHIVWCTKYRKQILWNGIDAEVMKGNTARWLFLKYPGLKRSLWGGHLWNPSYCAITVSDRSREQVEQYIESQKEKAWGGRGRPPKDLERLQAYHREVLKCEGDIFLQSGDPETS